MAVTLQVKITLILVSAISVAFLGTLQVLLIHVGHSVIINKINSWGRNYLEIVKAPLAS